MSDSPYCGRLAPTPTGRLHLGHARTFRAAWKRAREAGGRVLLRFEDLDRNRCRPEYARAAMEDLAWLGMDWDGPPIFQSEHPGRYLEAWSRLRDGGWIYPCTRSRKDLRSLPPPPDAGEQDSEPLYPPAWRPPPGTGKDRDMPGDTAWRFRVPDGECIHFRDAVCGEVRLTAGTDFGDFVIWRRDGIPSYELAVVVDDNAEGITEVVRGQDLLRSTARQLLLYRALDASPPLWCHQPLVRDASGRRLAKRDQDLSLRTLRERGLSPREVLTDLS